MGEKLLRELAVATGLPSDVVNGELRTLLEKNGKNPREITLDELRDLLAAYLRDVIVHAKETLDLTELEAEPESETV